MKTFVITCIVSLCLGSMCLSEIHAQQFRNNVRFGFKAGVTSTSVQPEDLLIRDRDDVEYLELATENARLGVQLGGFMRISGESLFIQPEVSLRTVSTEYRWREVRNVDISFKDENFYYLDVPIIAGAYLGPLRLQGGPVANFLLVSRSDIDDVDGFDRRFNGTGWGLKLGIGLDIGPVVLDAFYERQLSRKEELDVDGVNYELDPGDGQLGLSLGIAL